MDQKLEIVEALTRISNEKNIDMDTAIATLVDCIRLAVKRKYGHADNALATVDRVTGAVRVYYLRKVVETVADPVLEVSLHEAQGLDPKSPYVFWPASVAEDGTWSAVFSDTPGAPDAKLDEFVVAEEDLMRFGRNAIQVAKQNLIQRLREHERDSVYDDFHHKKGDIVSGTVDHFEFGNIIVRLGRTEGIIPTSEQSPRDHYREGDTIRAYVIDVQRTARGPQILMSRRHPDFLRKLFEYEVPEIYEQRVIIKGVAREAGERSKISVFSVDERIDPVGACVGLRGARVQNIIKELNNERIDIVPFDPDPARYVLRALGPAEALFTAFYPDENRVLVVVDESKRALAIGKGGQNVRLAARLTGFRIDCLGEAEFEEIQRAEDLTKIEVTRLPGVGARLAEQLVSHGFESAQKLAKAVPTDLERVPGITGKRAEQLIAVAIQATQHLQANPHQAVDDSE